MVGNVLIGLQTDDCIQSCHTYHFWKKESHSGQNPKCLPQKRLFQSPKYFVDENEEEDDGEEGAADGNDEEPEISDGDNGNDSG